MTGAGNRLSSAKRTPEEGGERDRETEKERKREREREREGEGEREWDVKNYYIIARAKEHVRAHVAM